MSFEPSLVRRALDELLRLYPHFDLISIGWHTSYESPDIFSPWVLVQMGQPSDSFEIDPAWAVWQFAIWKKTGAIHTMSDGAVSDDPIWTPQ